MFLKYLECAAGIYYKFRDIYIYIYVTSAMSNTDVAPLYKVPVLHVKRPTKHKENRGDINDLKKPREHLS